MSNNRIYCGYQYMAFKYNITYKDLKAFYLKSKKLN